MKLHELLTRLHQLEKELGPDIEVLTNPSPGKWPPMPAKVGSLYVWDVNATRYLLVLEHEPK